MRLGKQPHGTLPAFSLPGLELPVSPKDWGFSVQKGCSLLLGWFCFALFSLWSMGRVSARAHVHMTPEFISPCWRLGSHSNIQFSFNTWLCSPVLSLPVFASFISQLEFQVPFSSFCLLCWAVLSSSLGPTPTPGHSPTRVPSSPHLGSDILPWHLPYGQPACLLSLLPLPCHLASWLVPPTPCFKDRRTERLKKKEK